MSLEDMCQWNCFNLFTESLYGNNEVSEELTRSRRLENGPNVPESTICVHMETWVDTVNNISTFS